MDITVRCFDPGYQKPSFTLTVQARDTIALLKYQICEEESIPIHEQRIVPNIDGEAPPDDDLRLEACGIKHGDILTMYRIRQPPPKFGIDEPFKIGLRPTLGGTFLIEVRRSDTLRTVKRKIARSQGYFAEDLTFNYEDGDDDGKTLDDHHVDEPQTLRLWMGQRRKVTVPESSSEGDGEATPAASDTHGGDGGSDRAYPSDERGVNTPETEEGDSQNE